MPDKNYIALKQDKEVYQAIKKEFFRQQNQIELIASENIVSLAVLEAQGSALTNKYAEGYPGRRYYGGCDYVDQVEILAIERACQLFNCRFANVQPHSGSQANQAVFLSLLSPNDTIQGMSLSSGGHLTHGAAPNLSGKWFRSVTYGVRQDDGLLDYEAIHSLAVKEKPKLIVAGASAYTRPIDFQKFREIADDVGAYLLADVAHYAGLIVVGEYPNPFPHAHIVTSTTHKTLRGPRGGLILTNDEALAKKINSAVFPGLQGGPLMHVIAAKAVAFGEALTPDFRRYSQQVIRNARTLATTLQQRGIDLVSGGTDCHMVLVDLRNINLTGKEAEQILEEVGLTCNKNTVPFDERSPFVTSGLRLGTPAATTRGFKEIEFEQIADFIADLLLTAATDRAHLEKVQEVIKSKVKVLCDRFPIYKIV